jgi:hypothetical protein
LKPSARGSEFLQRLHLAKSLHSPHSPSERQVSTGASPRKGAQTAPGVNLTIPIRLSDAEFALRQRAMKCFRQFVEPDVTVRRASQDAEHGDPLLKHKNQLVAFGSVTLSSIRIASLVTKEAKSGAKNADQIIAVIHENTIIIRAILR